MQGPLTDYQRSMAAQYLMDEGITVGTAFEVVGFAAQEGSNQLAIHTLFDDAACPDGRQATIADLRTELVATVQQPGFAAAIKKKSGVSLSQPERDALNRYHGVQQAFQRLQTAAVAAADDVEQPSIADYLTRGEMPPVGHWMTMRDMTDLLGEQMTEPTAIMAPGTVTLPPCVAEDDSFPIMVGHVRAHAARLDDVIYFQSPMLVGHSHWVRVSGTMSADGALTAEVHNTLGDASRNRPIGAEASDEPQYEGIANALAASPSTSSATLVCNGQQETGWSCGYMAGAAALGAPVAQAEFAAVDWCIQTIAANNDLTMPAPQSAEDSVRYDVGNNTVQQISRAEQIHRDALLARALASDPHADFDTVKQRLFGTASFAESPTRASAAAAAASVTTHDTSSAAASAAAIPSSCPFQAAHASRAAVPQAMRTGLSATEMHELDSSSASASAC